MGISFTHHNNNRTMSEQKILNPIINRIEDLYINKNESYTKIIDFQDIKKGDLYVNLIHYDKNLKNKENMNYYRYFTYKIMGSYCPFDDFDILKLYISKLNQIPFPPTYILMTSGSEAEIILKEFNNNDYINDFIIFCHDKPKFKHLKAHYKKLKLIANYFPDIINFLKNKKHSNEFKNG